MNTLLLNKHRRALFPQVGLALILVIIATTLIGNTLQNLESRNIQTGFDFLDMSAGFGIGETSIAYSTTSSYGLALLVGLLNTLKVSILAIVFSTVLGVLIGIARLSPNWLLAKSSGFYVEFIRNVPLLLQLFLWYALITGSLPITKAALNLGDTIFLSNRGLFFPSLHGFSSGDTALVLLALCALMALCMIHRRKRNQNSASHKSASIVSAWMLYPLAGVGLIAYVFFASEGLEYPILQGFNFVGGTSITPEFIALVFGLSVYTAAYIGEIVRAGILSVSKGQREAAIALGLTPSQTMLKVILPQTLRTVIPPTTSWYLNTVKNSSLAIVVGYPDLVSIADTMINQTGQAIEGVAILMATYLTISLSITALLNWYNARMSRFGSTAGGSIEPPLAPSFNLFSLVGITGWLRYNFFSTPVYGLLTLVVAAGILTILPRLIDWAILSSVVNGSAQECRAAGGACWAFIVEKYPFILFGTYPFEEQWRPALAVLLFAGITCISFNQRLWRPALLWAWAAVILTMLLLMSGGMLGLKNVPTSLWGGLPVTLLLATLAIIGGLPLGMILALGRVSSLPMLRVISTTYIEFIRGVPLITVLFMAAVMFPLFMPPSIVIDNFLRVQLGLILFAAAYMAEVIRGGLQSVPQGQYEGAKSLGMNYWQSMRKVILPQALRVSIPSMVNTFISEVKNTTLVMIVGLFDLLLATKTALADPLWREFYIEAFVFTSLLFFLICFSLSRGSQMLEHKINTKQFQS